MFASIESNIELQRVLWACDAYADTEPVSLADQVVCFKWVAPVYERRFQARFHKARLEQLARLGLLEKADTSRGGHRRYYRISNPKILKARLVDWQL